MADNKSPEARSRNMAAVRSANTRPEVKVRRALWKRGLRFFTAKGWRSLTGKKLAGSPDIIFPGRKIVVFIDGCFWHGCPEHYTLPENNRQFWERKLAANLARDAEVNRELHALGWEVVRIWEHELRRKSFEHVVSRIAELVRSTQ